MDSHFGNTRRELRNYKWISMDRLGDKNFLILGKINNFCVRMASLAITGLGRNEIYLWLCRCKYDSISCLYNISITFYNSFSASGNHSGVDHDATAFVGCAQNQVYL